MGQQRILHSVDLNFSLLVVIKPWMFGLVPLIVRILTGWTATILSQPRLFYDSWDWDECVPKWSFGRWLAKYLFDTSPSKKANLTFGRYVLDAWRDEQYHDQSRRQMLPLQKNLTLLMDKRAVACTPAKGKMNPTKSLIKHDNAYTVTRPWKTIFLFPNIWS